jgi:hypothetical protein
MLSTCWNRASDKQMKTFFIRTTTLLIWIAITVVFAVLYGVVNDQMTVSISSEYYSVYKYGQFMPWLDKYGLVDAPLRVQAVLIGTLATWWYGVFLGIMLGISSMVGRYAPLSTGYYLRIVGAVMMATLAVSVIFGSVAFTAAPFVHPSAEKMPFLEGIQNVRNAYTVGSWHNGSYLGAFISTVIAGFWAQWKRRALYLESKKGASVEGINA